VSARRLLLLVGVLLALGGTGWAGARMAQDRFDHLQHKALFPSCLACHAGVADTTRSIWPKAEGCAACHDGTVEKRVEWEPPEALPRTNLRFTHAEHRQEVVEAHPGPVDSVLACTACHGETGAPRMQVRLAVPRNCLDCHGIEAEHLEAPDTACATCHVPLVRAVRLTTQDVSEFPEPESHEDPDFMTEHGKRAERGAPKDGIAASCATCHARDFCAECHVNAPEVPVIQALGPDPRSLAKRPELEAPRSHEEPQFIEKHGGQARKRARTCAACHTQESCLTCHAPTPGVAQAMPVAGPGRGRGAVTERRRPASHGPDFSENHGPVAGSRQQSCATCHARAECYSCHQPSAGEGTPGYHPGGFLSRHPAAAYARETDCTSCHNTRQFCTNCHVNAGFFVTGTLRPGYHDAKRNFLLGHGQAARQELESCVSCHTETQCLRCHAASVAGGRNFNPHGPGFDPDRLRRKNPQTCTACHGTAIPGIGE
jgi:hypothetical protein